MKKIESLKKFMNSHKNAMLIVSAFLITAILFLYTLTSDSQYFLTNDDYRIRLIASGAYSGSPSFQLVFVNQLVGKFLQLLYQINATLPWYDIATILCMYLPVVYLFYYLIARKNVHTMIRNLGFYLLFYFFILQKHILLPQFTITAALLGMGAVIALLKLFEAYEKKDKKGFILNAVVATFFNALCFGIRDEVFVLVAVLEVFILAANFILNKNSIKSFAKVLTCVVLVCLGMQLSESFLSSANYKEFKEYTKSRSLVYDYYSIPEYIGHEKFYDSIGLKENTVNALLNRTLDVDDSLNTETYLKVAEYKKDLNKVSLYTHVRLSITDSFKMLISDEMLPQSLFLSFLFVLSLIQVFKDNLDKKKIYLLGCMGFILFGTVMLTFRGRIVVRVMEAIYLISIPLLLSLCTQKEIVQFKISRDKGKILVVSMSAFLSIFYLLSSYMFVKDNISNQMYKIEKMSSRLEALTSYATKHPENFYFYNALDFIGGSDKLFNHSSDHSNILNIDSLGNWNAKSPTYYSRNKKFGFKSAIDGLINKENVFYVECNNFHSSIEGLLNTTYKKESVLVETIVATDGTQVNIYKIMNIEGENE